jgi:heparosan-N-sulfate-glucuronate 5-epimerase
VVEATAWGPLRAGFTRNLRDPDLTYTAQAHAEREQAGTVSARAQAPRTQAGFFSSARTFFLPVGKNIDPAAVRGYPIDLTVKAHFSDAAARERALTADLHVATIQYGLGCYERWLSGDGDEWLDAALEVGRHLAESQQDDGSWLHRKPFPHTFDLAAPWPSAMAQGEGASLFVRLHISTGEEAFAAAARAALEPLSKTRAEGGVRAELDGGPWFEEYPTDPPSYVLNGALFALWGARDVAVALRDDAAQRIFAAGVDVVAANLWRFDTGWWSLYSLYPHRMPNVASSFYHDLHVNQLSAMHQLCPRSEFDAMRARWQRYAASSIHQLRAFAAKVAFRLVVPRNRPLPRRALRAPDSGR